MDTETTGRRPRTRRPRPCNLESCERTTSGNTGWCSYPCKLVDRELDSAQRVCELIGNTPQTDELWCSAVEFADAMTRVRALKDEIYQAAMAVGMTNEQWHAVVHPPKGQQTST